MPPSALTDAAFSRLWRKRPCKSGGAETAAGLGVDRYNPLENVLGGAYYLRQQMDHFAGDGEYGLTEAVAAYNAGGGAVEKYGGVPPYAETINYVARIADIYEKLLRETNL